MKLYFATSMLVDNQRVALGSNYENILGNVDVGPGPTDSNGERESVMERLFSYFEVKGKDTKLDKILREITNATLQRDNG